MADQILFRMFQKREFEVLPIHYRTMKLAVNNYLTGALIKKNGRYTSP